MVERVLNLWDYPDDEPVHDDAGEEPAAVETVERRRQERWQALGQVELRWRDQDGNQQSAQAAMIERSPDGLRIISPREFTAGDEIRISLPKDGEDLKANVRHLEESGDGWHVGLRLIRNERRRFPRVPADGGAILRWLGSDQRSREAVVEVKNIAADGMQLRIPEPITVGTTVKVKGTTMQCVGVVWYCNQEGRSYLAGIQMSRDPYQNSTRDFHD
ncbi:MAG TPA: PilZ domain-containing protein [Bryobacterales bacterium]|nr:PilZ domain-containing protein [Bryobacterales bacterium]